MNKNENGVLVDFVSRRSPVLETSDQAVSTTAPVTTAPPQQTTPRERVRGAAPVCQKCGGAAFASSTRRHPAFVEARIRYFKCGSCGFSFKNVL